MKVWKWQNEDSGEKKGEAGFFWHRIFTTTRDCLFMLISVSAVHVSVCVFLAVSLLCVCLSLCLKPKSGGEMMSRIPNVSVSHLSSALLRWQWLGDRLTFLGCEPTWARISPRHQNFCVSASVYVCVWERQSASDGSVHVKLCIRPHANELCVFVHACQWPRGTAGLRNDLNGHSCNSITTGCFNGRTLWAREQGNDRSGRWNALILSQWWEGMLPLSDGLIAPALIDRQHRPLRSPGNTGPSLPHTHTDTHTNEKPATLLFSHYLQLKAPT